MSPLSRGQVRWLAHAALLSPAPARPRGRTDWRAAAELLSTGLLAPRGNGYVLSGIAGDWLTVPREALAKLAEVDSISAARAILSVFGSSAILAENGTNPPENGTSPPGSGTRISPNGTASARSVVVAFPQKTESKITNNSCAMLLQIGVATRTARRLAIEFPENRVNEVVAAAANAENPPAWAVSALRGEWVVPQRNNIAGVASAKRPLPDPTKVGLWPDWHIAINAVRNRIPQEYAHVLDSLHAVCDGKKLRLLAPNRAFMQCAGKFFLEITGAVEQVDSSLQVELSIGSAYAAA